MNAPRWEVEPLLQRIDEQGRQAAAHGGKPTAKQSAKNDAAFQDLTAWREGTFYNSDTHTPELVDDSKGHYRAKTQGEVANGEPDSYLSLADKNGSHFSPDNIKNWRAEHKRACELAASTIGKSAIVRKVLLNQAYARDAFACHFLTDAFASGHLIDGEAGRDYAIDFWSKHRGAIYLAIQSAAIDDHWYASSSIALIETLITGNHCASVCLKLVHDHLNEQGIIVKNQRGDVWKTYGDQNLSRSPETQRLAREAVRMSRLQIDLAGQGNEEQMETPEVLVPSQVSTDGGRFMPLAMFARNPSVFDDYLKASILSPHRDNPLYRLIRANEGLAANKAKQGATDVLQSFGESQQAAATSDFPFIKARR